MATKAPTRSKPARPALARLTLDEAMSALEAAGSEQTRKTYARHGVEIPMFGVSFANAEREAMNLTLIAMGGRYPALRKAATAAAKRIGKVDIDHGNTACMTPDAVESLNASWDHAAARQAASPAAQERARESMRTRC